MTCYKGPNRTTIVMITGCVFQRLPNAPGERSSSICLNRLVFVSLSSPLGHLCVGFTFCSGSVRICGPDSFGSVRLGL